MSLIYLVGWSFILITSILFLGVYRKYKNLTKKERQNLEKQLRQLGFFIIVTVIWCIPVNAIALSIDEVTNENPIVLPANSMTQASEIISSMFLDKSSETSNNGYLDEDTWRHNIALFLDDNYPCINNTYNNSTLLINNTF